MGEGTPLTGRSVWWGCGRWCSWASLGFRFLVGMPSHFRSRLGSVWSAMVLTSEWTGLLSVYTRVCDAHTHTKMGHPFHHCPSLGLVPSGAVGWEPRPLQGGQAGCWLGSWWGLWVAVGQGAGKTALRRRVCSKRTWHTALAWHRDQRANPGLHKASFVGGNGASTGSACLGTRPWERTCARLPSQRGAWSQGPGVEQRAGVPPATAFGGGGSRRCPEAGSGASDGQRRCAHVRGGQQPPSSRQAWLLAPEPLEGIQALNKPQSCLGGPGRWGCRWGQGGFGVKPVLALLAEPICAVGHGVAALCCATSEDRSWVFQGYSVTGVSAHGWGGGAGAAGLGP